MSTNREEIVALEKKFWQSMVDQDTDTALSLLQEPSLLVGTFGAMKFDHATYRQMAEQGPKVVTAFALKDIDVVFPNDDTAILTYRVAQTVAPRGTQDGDTTEMIDSSTWVRSSQGWRCAMHTETATPT